MGSELTQEQCRGIAEAYVAYLNAVGEAVPSGPPNDPDRFHYGWWFAEDAGPLRIENGWLFPVKGSLTGHVMEQSVAVPDVRDFQAACRSFLCSRSPCHGWEEGLSFGGLWREAHGVPASAGRGDGHATTRRTA